MTLQQHDRDPATVRWSLGQYIKPESPVPRLGLLADDRVLRPPTGWPNDLMAMVEHWHQWEARLTALDPSTLDEVTEVRLVAPLTYPRKVICAGANYYDHAEEMGTKRPNPTDPPFFFLKPPTTTVIGPLDEIRVHDLAAAKVDWEAELAVVIADRCKNVPVSQASSHVAGYLVANDISARGLFTRPSAVFPPFEWDWLAHKGGDGFCPIGPGLVPAWQIPDPQNLGIQLAVNGVVKQRTSTSNMVMGVDGLIAAASRLMTLEPGDVILTGTGAGVGMPRADFLASGDVMVTEVEGLGKLTNTVVENR